MLMISVCNLHPKTGAVKKIAGEHKSFSADGLIFNMIYVPGNLTFPMGIDDKETGTVDHAYWIAETELNYELWYKVRYWAEKHGYNFAYKGKEGSSGKPGAFPTEAKNSPVTGITWRDAVIWSNALTEWYNAVNRTKYICVYYEDSNFKKIIKNVDRNKKIYLNNGTQDNPYQKNDADGFRLLTSKEWELAARYIDGKKWTQGNYMSGSTTSHTKNLLDINESDIEIVAWFSKVSTQDTKMLKANSLGLYDMSGNVWELCFDLLSEKNYPGRVMRGGSCFYWVEGLFVGFVNKNAPYSPSYDVGLRVAMTAFGD